MRLNDHDQLRADPLVALLSGKTDLQGEHRRREHDRGKAGAGKSTLNRLELTPAKVEAKVRYKKIVLNEQAVDSLLVNTRVPVKVLLEGRGRGSDPAEHFAKIGRKCLPTAENGIFLRLGRAAFQVAQFPKMLPSRQPW
jgi:hypothetical protein